MPDSPPAINQQYGKDDLVGRIFRALDLPFEDEEFDVIWTQNALMYIEDKARVLAEAYRVVRSEGKLALETILAGPKSGLMYPVFWPDHPEVSHLSTPVELRNLLEDAGFLELEWLDVTQEAMSRNPADAPSEPDPLGIGVVYDDVPEKGENVMAGFQAGQLLNVYTVQHRST